MNKWRISIICLLSVLQLTAFAAPKEKKEKNEEPKRVYMFGAAIKFNDSVVYLTDVQHLDSITINPDGSIPNYAGYSLQLKVYLEGSMNEINQTCAIIYSDKKKKLEKRYLKMRKKYTLDESKRLKPIGSGDFAFRRY